MSDYGHTKAGHDRQRAKSDVKGLPVQQLLNHKLVYHLFAAKGNNPSLSI